MSKAKRRAQLKADERLRDARHWLHSNNRPSDLVAAFSKRYRVSRAIAVDDLNSLGYGEDVKIQQYEAEGIPWEFIVEPRSGEMYVVPQGATEYELHTYHGVVWPECQ